MASGHVMVRMTMASRIASTRADVVQTTERGQAKLLIFGRRISIRAGQLGPNLAADSESARKIGLEICPPSCSWPFLKKSRFV